MVTLAHSGEGDGGGEGEGGGGEGEGGGDDGGGGKGEGGGGVGGGGEGDGGGGEGEGGEGEGGGGEGEGGGGEGDGGNEGGGGEGEGGGGSGGDEGGVGGGDGGGWKLREVPSAQSSRKAKWSVFTPASRSNVRFPLSCEGALRVMHPFAPSPCAFTGPVHSLNEFVEPDFPIFGCVQSEVLLASNTKEPGRPARPTSYVPVRGAITVISNEPLSFDLKKTSLVESSTPTAGLSVGAKGAR